MADRMAAEIWIGGTLRRSLLEEFPISDLRLDWDNNCLASSAEADILAARDEDGLLHFADVEAAWGEFEELEGWLREHNLPFRRRSEGKYEHMPELVEFRPDLKGKRNRDVYAITSPEGAPWCSRPKSRQSPLAWQSCQPIGSGRQRSVLRRGRNSSTS